MKRYVNWYLRILVLSVGLNFLIETIGRKSMVDAAMYLLMNPVVFLINAGIILVPFSILFLTKRKIFVCSILTLAWAFVGLVNGFLLTFRTTPFTGADLRLLKYGLNMLDTYMNWFQIIAVTAGLALAFFGCFFLWKRAPVDSAPVIKKIGVPVTVLTVLFVLGATEAAMATGLVAVRFGNIGQAYEDYGFAYCFSNSLFNTGISKPEEYSVETLAVIERQELAPKNLFGISENKTPNIVMIQLESFFDPKLWVSNPVDYDPIPYFRYLMHTYPSGYLSVPSVGAGTANTEFEAITGMNLDFFGPGEYPYKTVLNKTSCESTAFDLKNLGYTAHAIHNNEGTFYDRNHVFPQLGFDTFTPIEYMYEIERNQNSWCKDKILVDEIGKALDSTEGSDFVYAISVQGHGAYESFEYYCEQIREMDTFIRLLINALNDRGEPVALVLYGDHLPGFEWKEEDMKNGSLYQTQYVIWNNMGLQKEDKDVEAYQLSAHVLDLLGIHEGTMIRFHQNHLNKRYGNERAYLRDMKVLEYDILYGDHEIYGGESPYPPTDMKMGVIPITVDQVVYQSSNLLVFGENFNEYSKICINDKTMDTIYVSSQLIVAPQIPEKKVHEVSLAVKQVGRDKVPLGDPIFPSFPSAY